jgi:hypothetical protein
LSFDVENNKSPSKLYFTCVIDRSCPFNRIGCYRQYLPLKKLDSHIIPLINHK